MGWPIYREVKVWAPASLTHREKLTALVLADDANDETRLTFSSVVHPDILSYALVKTDRDMRKVLAKLQDAKVIEQAVAGHNGRIAKYRFLHLDPAGCPGKPQCQCPLAVQKGPATPEAEPTDTRSVGGPNQTAYSQPSRESTFQKEPPTDGVGGPNRHRRGSKKDRPTPTTSSNSSSVPADAHLPAARRPGGGGNSRQSQATTAAGFVAGLDYLGKALQGWQAKRLTGYVEAALAAGWAEAQLGSHLDLGSGSGVRDAFAIYEARLKDTPRPPAVKTVTALGCGICRQPGNPTPGWFGEDDEGRPRPCVCNPRHPSNQK